MRTCWCATSSGIAPRKEVAPLVTTSHPRAPRVLFALQVAMCSNICRLCKRGGTLVWDGDSFNRDSFTIAVLLVREIFVAHAQLAYWQLNRRPLTDCPTPCWRRCNQSVPISRWQPFHAKAKRTGCFAAGSRDYRRATRMPPHSPHEALCSSQKRGHPVAVDPPHRPLFRPRAAFRTPGFDEPSS